MQILPKDHKPWVQETAGKYHYVWYVPVACTKILSEMHEVSFAYVGCLIKDGMLTYWYDENDMLALSGRLFENRKDKVAYTQKLMQQWDTLAKKFFDVCTLLDKTTLEKLSDKELIKIYSDFSKTYMDQYALALFTDAAGLYLENKVTDILKHEIPDKKQRIQYMVALTQPTKESFLGKEKRELFEIVAKQLSGKDITKDVKKHTEKWYWIQNNYFRILELDENYFLERIKEHNKHAEEVQNFLKEQKTDGKRKQEIKDEILKKIGVAELNEWVQLADDLPFWQDCRKEANLRADHYLNRFLNEVANRSGIPLSTLEYTTGNELLHIMNGEQVDLAEIEERLELTGLWFTPSNNETLNLEQAKQLEVELNRLTKNKQPADIHGNIANIGKVHGKVKIVLSTKDFHKVEKGDILVTSMTRPDFVPVLKKVAGIITDEGGITCHAAIVSRELDVPCILGTKIATKILKDDQYVELDANHGVVRL